MQEEFDIEIDWRGFQLHPEVPPGGITMAHYFGEARARAAGDRVRAFAAEFGLEIRVHDRVPSTLRALAVTELARDRGLLTACRDALMDAHWRDGLDIESDEVLGDVAERVGLGRADGLAAADDPAHRARLAAARAEAHAQRVHAIPTFFIGDQVVVGCQRYETMQLVAAQAGVPRR